MSKELLGPSDEKVAASVAPTEEPGSPPVREPDRAGREGFRVTDLINRVEHVWQQLPIAHLSKRAYLTAAGIFVAAAVILTLLVSILAAPSTSKSRATTTVPQVKVPIHQVYTAQPPAAPQGSTVDLTLDAKQALITIAPGIAYHAWTFNGTVPGPILRVRQGQTVHFTLVNDDPTMPHSIDFHAAQTPWNINYQPVAPGKSFSFDWQANYPGVFMYHCGAPAVLAHMANGMYGAIIVDPASGWSPAQEYVLVESEFYLLKAPDGSYYLNATKALNSTPDYVVFNGYADQYKAAPLLAKAGQPIRIFLVNAGPSLFEAFHVIGAIFSDEYIDGNPANHLVGDQTVMVPPGGGDVVELTIPSPGLYPFVTHDFAAASMGATGVLKVTQ